MIEILEGQVCMVNKMLRPRKMCYGGRASISAVDRNAEAVVYGSFLEGRKHTVTVSMKDGAILSGGENMLPTDAALHMYIYKNCPQIRVLTHIYPDKCSKLSWVGQNIALCSTQHAIEFKNAIPCTRALTDEEIGSDYMEAVGKTVIEAMEKNEILDFGAVLLRNDGALVWGTTPAATLEKAAKLEGIASKMWGNFYSKQIQPADMNQKLADKVYQDAKNREDMHRECLGVPGTPVTAEDERKISFQMLVYFDKICRENGIKYSLTGGTLLGAIRHSGFIPWDDDVDVFLSRPEFDKLEAAFPEDHRFVYVTRNKDPKFNYVFGRLIDTKTLLLETPNTVSAGRGVFLDVCVVDGLPNNKFRQNLHIKYMRTLIRLRRATIQNPKGKSYRRKGALFVFAKKIVRSLTDYHFWNRRLEKAMSRYSYEDAEYIGNFTSQYGKKERMTKKAFDSYLDVEFEGQTFMICGGYKEYLGNVYRNYMSYPPVEKRKGHHPNTAVWVE